MPLQNKFQHIILHEQSTKPKRSIALFVDSPDGCLGFSFFGELFCFPTTSAHQWKGKKISHVVSWFKKSIGKYLQIAQSRNRH